MTTCYTVRQVFGTLGDPCVEQHATLEAAQAAAAALRVEIARVVANQPVGEVLDGWASELAAWREAAFLADGCTHYGPAAAKLIAARAVVVEADK